MDRLRRDVILIRLIEALREKGSWCGETHVQKGAFFLQEMAGADTDFEFILYKHGPFAFDLRDELAAMRADGLVSLRVQSSGYGPSMVPEPAAEALRQRFPKTLRMHEPLVSFVADRLGSKPVSELERLATAFYVLKTLGEETHVTTCAQRIHMLKPHISEEDAAKAVQTVETWKQEAAEASV